MVGLFNNPHQIETFTGRKVDPVHLTPEDIDIEDIIHHLSLLCRFVGACERFYSVGQHSIHVAELVAGMNYNDDAEARRKTILTAILHDAAEAYTGDIARPLKHQFKPLQEIDARNTGIIMQKFGAIGGEWEYVKEADNTMLWAEAYELMHSKGKDWDFGNYSRNISPVKLMRRMTTGEVQWEFKRIFDWRFKT